MKIYQPLETQDLTMGNSSWRHRNATAPSSIRPPGEKLQPATQQSAGAAGTRLRVGKGTGQENRAGAALAQPSAAAGPGSPTAQGTGPLQPRATAGPTHPRPRPLRRRPGPAGLPRLLLTGLGLSVPRRSWLPSGPAERPDRISLRAGSGPASSQGPWEGLAGAPHTPSWQPRLPPLRSPPLSLPLPPAGWRRGTTPSPPPRARATLRCMAGGGG